MKKKHDKNVIKNHSKKPEEKPIFVCIFLVLNVYFFYVRVETSGFRFLLKIE